MSISALLKLADRWNDEGFSTLDTSTPTTPHEKVVEALTKRRCARELEGLVIEHLRRGVDTHDRRR